MDVSRYVVRPVGSRWMVWDAVGRREVCRGSLGQCQRYATMAHRQIELEIR